MFKKFVSLSEWMIFSFMHTDYPCVHHRTGRHNNDASVRLCYVALYVWCSPASLALVLTLSHTKGIKYLNRYYKSGRYPTWRTISSMICLFESSTCFEQHCAHPQEDNCINTTSGVSGHPVSRSRWNWPAYQTANNTEWLYQMLY